MRRIAFYTLGCKANWVDTEKLSSICENSGLKIVSFEESADVYVVNTCTVTSVADGQSKQMIRRAKRLNSNAIVIAMGCSAKLSGDKITSVEDVIEYLSKNFGIDFENNHQKLWEKPQSRARAFLKIQDGCDNSCAYCIVPRVRGKSKSLSPDEIVTSCKKLSQYHNEIVLTGIDISQYGKDLAIYDLLEKLVRIDGIPRIRLSSISPPVVNKRLVSLMKSENICRHVHLSIQSCSNDVLSRMNRKYLSIDILRAINMLTENIDGVAITGDVIAGFPGESDLHHRETLELLSNLPISSLHVFPYSERENTSAASMPQSVPISLRKERASELRNIGVSKRKTFLRGLSGRKLEVIVTSKSRDENGFVDTFSDNAVQVKLPCDFMKYGEMGTAVITEVCDLKVKGTWDLHQKKNPYSSFSKKRLATSLSIKTI